MPSPPDSLISGRSTASSPISSALAPGPGAGREAHAASTSPTRKLKTQALKRTGILDGLKHPSGCCIDRLRACAELKPGSMVRRTESVANEKDRATLALDGGQGRGGKAQWEIPVHAWVNRCFDR